MAIRAPAIGVLSSPLVTVPRSVPRAVWAEADDAPSRVTQTATRACGRHNRTILMGRRCGRWDATTQRARAHLSRYASAGYDITLGVRGDVRSAEIKIP